MIRNVSDKKLDPRSVKFLIIFQGIDRFVSIFDHFGVFTRAPEGLRNRSPTRLAKMAQNRPFFDLRPPIWSIFRAEHGSDGLEVGSGSLGIDFVFCFFSPPIGVKLSKK